MKLNMGENVSYSPVVMAAPKPAKMKRKVAMNSTTSAWMQSGLVTSWIEPIAIFAIVANLKASSDEFKQKWLASDL